MRAVLCSQVARLSLDHLVGAMFSSILLSRGWTGGHEQLSHVISWLAANEVHGIHDMGGLGDVSAIPGADRRSADELRFLQRVVEVTFLS